MSETTKTPVLETKHLGISFGGLVQATFTFSITVMSVNRRMF